MLDIAHILWTTSPRSLFIHISRLAVCRSRASSDSGQGQEAEGNASKDSGARAAECLPTTSAATTRRQQTCPAPERGNTNPMLDWGCWGGYITSTTGRLHMDPPDGQIVCHFSHREVPVTKNRNRALIVGLPAMVFMMMRCLASSHSIKTQ